MHTTASPARGSRRARAGRRSRLTRRTRLARRAPLRRGPWRKPGDPSGTRASRKGLRASEAQRQKLIGSACVVCRQTKGIMPAHLAPRSLGGCDDPACVVPLCWMHHRAYDTGRLDLLPHLEPHWRPEIAHAVEHLGLIGALRRLSWRARKMGGPDAEPASD